MFVVAGHCSMVLSPLSRIGAPRGGTSHRGGSLLEQADVDHNRTYEEVISSGLRDLLCLGREVLGRWSLQSAQMLPELAQERSRGLHPRIRWGIAAALQDRWWGIFEIALQRAVAHCVLHADVGANLVTTLLAPAG